VLELLCRFGLPHFEEGFHLLIQHEALLDHSLALEVNGSSCVALPSPWLKRRVYLPQINGFLDYRLLNFFLLYFRAVESIPMLAFLHKYR